MNNPCSKRLTMLSVGMLVGLGLSACASPRVGVGVGTSVGDVRIGVSTSDLGKTVVPRVGVRAGNIYGGVAGPRIDVLPDGSKRVVQPEEIYDPAPTGPEDVKGTPAPGVETETDE